MLTCRVFLGIAQCIGLLKEKDLHWKLLFASLCFRWPPGGDSVVLEKAAPAPPSKAHVAQREVIKKAPPTSRHLSQTRAANNKFKCNARRLFSFFCVL